MFHVTAHQQLTFMKKLLVVLTLVLTLTPSRAQVQTFSAPGVDTVLTGQWTATVMGSLGQFIRVVLDVTRYTDGPCDAYFSIPLRGRIQNRFSSVSCDGATFMAASDTLGFRFEGTIRDESVLEGTWTDNRTSAWVQFRKLRPVQRTQEPGPNPGYAIHHFDVVNRDGGARFGATLTAPDTTGRWPLIVFISDRGRHDRNASEESGHKPFLVLAHMVTTQGYATVRFDDRHLNLTDDAQEPTTTDVADDVLHVIKRLTRFPWVDTSNIILIGHGEGGIAASLVGTLRPDVRGIVCAATPAADGEDLLLSQIRAFDKLMRIHDSTTTFTQSIVRAWLDIIESDPDDAGVTIRIGAYMDSVMQKASPAELNNPVITPFRRTSWPTYVRSVLIPWLRSYDNLEPEDLLKICRIPTLALLAAQDRFVPCEINETAWKTIAESRSNVTVITIPNVDHRFRPCTTCLPEETEMAAETVAPTAIDSLLLWIRQRTAN